MLKPVRVATNKQNMITEYIEQHSNGVLFYGFHSNGVEGKFPCDFQTAKEYMKEWGRELNVNRLPYPTVPSTFNPYAYYV